MLQLDKITYHVYIKDMISKSPQHIFIPEVLQLGSSLLQNNYG